MSEREPITDTIFVMPDLSGPSGNAFVLLGMAKHAFRQDGVDQKVVDEFYADATSGDYEHLLDTILRYFVVVVDRHEYEVHRGSARDLLPGRDNDEEVDDLE